MIFHKQLNAHRPPESWGDCMRTCIACMLDKHPSEVPNFFENADDEAGQEKGWWCLEMWLTANGYKPVIMPSKEDPRPTMEYCARDCYYILMGTGNNGGTHSVIAKNDEIAFDPSWGDHGIVGPAPSGIYNIMLLIDNKFAEGAI